MGKMEILKPAFATLFVTMLSASASSADMANHRLSCHCNAAFSDIWMQETFGDGTSTTGHDWDEKAPGLSEMITRAVLETGVLQRGQSTIVDIGVTEMRFAPQEPMANPPHDQRWKSITMGSGERRHVEYLFCRAEPETNRLYEIGILYRSSRSGSGPVEMVSYVSTSLLEKLQENRCRARR